jgi:proline iminopeptidase
MRRLDDTLYPITPTRTQGYLDRNGHRIYFAESGNPLGVPMVIVHGGPGGQSSDAYRRLASADSYRIIQFDQRGCGKSESELPTKDNTLQHTIEDMEALREATGAERWVVAGGSWGSTVALAYAEAHPDRCLGLLLVSTWLVRKADIDWWFYGVGTVFPELWNEFASLAPDDERDNLLAVYHRMIHGEDAEMSIKASRSLHLYEEAFMHADAPFMPNDGGLAEKYARIFIHYAANNFFLRENQIIEDASRIAHLPAILVTGRYDMCTPPNNAWDLAQVLPKADLRIIRGGGHYPTEHAMAYECARASHDLKRML